MTLFILTETSAGYALLKAKDKKLLDRDDVSQQANTAEGICELLKLKKFEKFDSAATALEEVSGLVDGKVTPLLSKLLDSIKDERKVSLAVADPKLGTAIHKLPQLSIKPVSDSSTADLFRAIRTHLPSLIPALSPNDISTMSLGLSHSLSRHKLKFSPDKVDTMIIQAIALLDDLDKELNIYAMRVKEWYGWHFPEMAKIINDNLAYAKVILKMGVRSNAGATDLAEVLPEPIETAIKAAAEISMGSDISTEDLENIRALADQVVELTEYRQQLSNYLSARMTAIAPNLTTLVGELVGARLISHAGSLINLAKSPASTIQILGAEKALFRALKTKHDTPKYGLLYHASLVGQATGKNKGKIARMLATKTALGLRIDAMADWGVEGGLEGDKPKREPTDEEKIATSLDNKIKIERRLRHLEGRPLRVSGTSAGPAGQSQPAKWELKEARKYNPNADGLSSDAPAAAGSNEKATAKPKAKLIEDVTMTDRTSKKPAVQQSDEDEDDDDEDEDEDAEEASRAHVNGDHANGEMSKEERKAAKAAKKAEKAARKAARAEKRAKKEAKRAAKEAAGDDDEGKKRKREDGEGKSEKKKKKKHHD